MIIRVVSKVLLRLQGSSFIRPHWRRVMLNVAGASIDKSAVVHHSCVLHGPNITMAPNSLLNVMAFYDGSRPLIIEEDVQVGPGAMFITGSHKMGWSERRAIGDTGEPITIGRGSWLGTRVTVLLGADIAPGCMIAAGTVVISRTERDGLYSGVPGVRKRDLS